MRQEINSQAGGISAGRMISGKAGAIRTVERAAWRNAPPRGAGRRATNKGYGTRLMRTVEQEAGQRRCRQIVLETHDFQAPEFYRKLGFEVTGGVPEYPRGHQLLTLVKQLP